MEAKKKLRVDSALCEYKDSTTSKISKTYDWRYLDNPENIPEGIYESIEWEVAEANRGIVNVKGDTKYGFFPDVNNMTCIVIYYDPLIVGGSFAFGSTY